MRPEIITHPEAFQARCARARALGARVGFVPTMGALHEGHLTLAREARARLGEGLSLVAVSIFVNPTQFGPREDLSRYPRELEDDVARCESAGVDVVFAPSPEEMYPPGDQTRVRVGSLAEPMCGPFRPGHFEGVATVVAKLFTLAGPCTAVFGRKDYQQWRVITRMARDLWMPVSVVGVPTVRESDGLAMSTRNRYLSPEARAAALTIPRALGDAARRYEAGERDLEALRSPVEAALRAVTDRIDYVSLRDADDLGELPPTLPPAGRAVLALAAHIGAARLIDNVVLGEDSPPA